MSVWFLPPVLPLLQCPCNPFHLRPQTCSPSHWSDVSHRLCWPDLPCASISSGISLSLPGIPPITKSWPAIGCTTASMASDRKSTRLNSSHGYISYAVFCLKKKKLKSNNVAVYH